ncbi:MAG: primosomal protein N' [Armatimonadetes bacterium]|nr:primosomal protein N' [Armatimonadota bacterium]
MTEEPAVRRPDAALEADSNYLHPTPAQQAVIDRVRVLLAARQFGQILLHGVTGSGKTEVYLHCLRETLRAGRQAIVLVPEISLTPQIYGRIVSRFGDDVAVLHSALSVGERYDEWQRLRTGQARIAVGPRSALFAPLQNVGLIVIDEEHEPAYKQESSPRYHARLVATELARRHNAVLLFGSATPSIETYHAALSGDVELFELPERIDSRPLPHVHIVDLRQDVTIGKGRTFSEPLAVAMEDALNRGEQVILFLNRRGFSTFVVCHKCGHRYQCPDCGISLTYHHHNRQLVCHYCGYSRAAVRKCENCGSEDIGFLGLGTERVAEQVERRFPGVAVARMDRDTVRRKGAHRDILAAFARSEVQVLVGTQMVAKGLDFPGVTLVGVLNADVGLAWSDFRAAERTFQLLTQVAGRAGRADKPGCVVVQTYSPEHPAITAAAHHDYVGFYAREIESRRRLLWPPFSHIARLLFSHEDKGHAEALAQSVALKLADMGVQRADGRVHYIGPAPAPLERLRGKWRYHLVVKAADRSELVEALAELVRSRQWQAAGGIVDIDPVDMI